MEPLRRLNHFGKAIFPASPGYFFGRPLRQFKKKFKIDSDVAAPHENKLDWGDGSQKKEAADFKNNLQEVNKQERNMKQVI